MSNANRTAPKARSTSPSPSPRRGEGPSQLRSDDQPGDPIIRLQAVSKTFNAGRHNAVDALVDIDVAFPRGQVSVLSGPSGSGKSTLLSLIGVLARPTSGRVLLDGRLLSNLPEPFMARVRRETFGFVFQRGELIRGLSLIENLMLPAYPLAPPRRALVRRAEALLARFGLSERTRHQVETLSGGETQRAAICRALINDPRIIIADEPTANLDSARSLQVLELLAELARSGRSVLISSHDPLVLDAAAVACRIELCDGRIASIDGATPC